MSFRALATASTLSKSLMQTLLYQKRRPWSSRRFTLLHDRIIVETSTLRERHKYEVRLDRLGFDLVYRSDDTRAGKLMLYLCLLTPAAVTISSFFVPIVAKTQVMVWLLCYLFAFLNVLREHSDDIQLVGGEQALVFYRLVPNESAVLAFIEQVIASAKLYDREKYTRIDVAVPEEIFMARLHWLLQREIITEKELQDLINDFKVKRLL